MRSSHRLLRLALAVGVVALCGYLLAREVDGLAASVRRLSPGLVVASGLLAVLGTICIQRLWTALLRGLGITVDGRDASEVFYVSQLGKYVPGSVWPVLAQMQLGLRWGASRRVMVAANVLLLVMVTVSGIVVGGLLLPWSSPDGIQRYWWLLLLLAPLVLLLHPRAVTGLVDLALGLLRRDPVRARVSAGGLVRAVLWALAAWLTLGAHLFVLMTPYHTQSLREAAAAVGGMGLAWAAGMAFIPAPAGAGVRETVLVLTLAPLVGAEAALTVALASRALLVVADVGLAAAASLRRRLRGPQRPVRSEVCSG